MMAAATRSSIVRLYGTDPNDSGQVTWSRSQPSDWIAAAEDDRTRQAKLVARYLPCPDGQRSKRLHSLVVQSNEVKNSLHNVFAGYHGVNTHATRLVFDAPLHPFVHRWDRFTTARDSATPGRSREAVGLLYDTLYEEIRDEVDRKAALQRDKYIDYEFLWAIFGPGDTVIAILSDQEQAAEICSARYHEDRSVFRARYIDFNGQQFGSVYMPLAIAMFDGMLPVTSLPVYPLQYHPQADMRQRLVERGRRWEEEYSRNQKDRFRHYQGPAILRSEGQTQTVDIDHRVLVGFDGCKSVYTERTPTVKAPTYIQLADEDRLLASSVLSAYSPYYNIHLALQPDLLRDIRWDTAAFVSLVFPDDQQDVKTLLLAAAKDHYNQVRQLQDKLIQNRDAGLIIRLSGHSGVGKTFTVESIAESMQVPLFVLAPNDLGQTVRGSEKELRQILRQLPQWNGILLLKNADELLQAEPGTAAVRPGPDAPLPGTPQVEEERDESPILFVSMFLRVIERYKGIIFFTTSHDNGIDPALHAHVHFWVRYRLASATRRRLWNFFLETETVTQDRPALGDIQLNGRHIKHAARMARQLAKEKNTDVTYQHVETVLRIGLE